MATPSTPPRAQSKGGHVIIDVEECKGCGLCMDACPPKCLDFEPELNAYGVRPMHYLGRGCTGCGICFYACPEPGAITVYKTPPPHVQARATTAREANLAASL
jgi:Pyruvate/2-oxoacid:ferredoxin oxidoreductase delta subunit